MTGDGDLANYSKFRDRLLLALAGLAISLMAYFVHQAQGQVDSVRVEIRELRERLNGELNDTAAFRSQQVAVGGEVVRRLNVLDGKMDGLTVLARRR